MAKVTEITVYATGVLQDKEARDTANCIAAAAAAKGKYVQAFDNYADLPDRVNVPVRKYARISDSDIEEKYQYENYAPEIVVVMEQTIIKGLNVLRGMPKGGTLVVNTPKSPEEILKFIPNKDLLSAIACVDGTKIAPEVTKDYSGAEGAIDATAIGKNIGAVMAGATAKVVSAIDLDALKSMVANPEGAQKGYDEAKVTTL